MIRTPGLLALGLAAVLLPVAGSAASPGNDVGDTAVQEQTVDFWQLWQSSGAELYQEMCASCHGVDGAGNGPAAKDLSSPTPALRYLERAGIPKQHWTYVLTSACEDDHHWARNSEETMPCWRRIFRQTLGNDAAPLLVSKKLTSYLASIQH